MEGEEGLGVDRADGFDDGHGRRVGVVSEAFLDKVVTGGVTEIVAHNFHTGLPAIDLDISRNTYQDSV